MPTVPEPKQPGIEAAKGGRPRKARTLEPTILAPFFVACDWLTLNLEGPWARMPRAEERRAWETDIGILYYQTKPGQTPTHLRIDVVTDANEQRLATIQSVPYGLHAYDEHWVRVQFDNNTLPGYHGGWADVYRILRMQGHEYRDIGQIDLAADAIEDDGGDYMSVVQRAFHGEGRYYGKGKWQLSMPEGRRSKGMKPDGAILGRRANDKFLRCYCKSQELKSKRKDPKPWIPEAWCGALGGEVLDTTRRVNRLEGSLKCQEVKRYWPQSVDESFLHKLGDQLFRRDMFASAAPTLFDFRSYAERARDAEPLAVWDWSRIGGDVQLSRRAARNYSISDQRLKLGIHVLWEMALAMSAPQVLEQAVEMARSAGPHIVQWMERQIPHWQRAYLHTLREGDERTRNYLSRLSGNDVARMIDEADRVDVERMRDRLRSGGE